MEGQAAAASVKPVQLKVPEKKVIVLNSITYLAADRNPD